jgi:hypothetical protein
MSQPTIIFCTTCKGRAQHIEQTLPKNLADNAGYPNCKFVVLDYNSPDHLQDYLRSEVFKPLIDSGRLVVYKFTESGPFRMAHAKNMAHRLGIIEGGEILVNLDADNFTGPNFADYIAEKFARFWDSNIKMNQASIVPGTFLWANRNQPSHLRYPKGCNGRIVVESSAFLKAGGYDETKYSTWGPDDKDFHFRLRRLGYLGAEISRVYLDVVLHSDKMRFKDYPHVCVEMEDEEFQQVCDVSTIANSGKFGCGLVYRNPAPYEGHWAAHRVELEPLPTRIFGIGMHKTATTSLYEALKILGVDAAHWENAHWAKAIWNEMEAEGQSATLERHYALLDLPITLLFKELDRAYPGSKFILTVRDEIRWLQSVQKHWSPDHNPHRGNWGADPFTNKVHKLLYGQKDFDALLFLARFRRHNAEVMEYFRDRPADLLVMDMDAGAGWAELCGFLGWSIPSVAYPVALATKAL